MQIEPSEKTGKIRIDCRKCGEFYEVDALPQDDKPMAEFMLNWYEKNRCCPACEREILREAELAAVEARQVELNATFFKRLEASNMPPSYTHDRFTGNLFIEPPKRKVSEFIWRNRKRNLLISGITGSGKSTSACFIGTKLLLSGSTVQYYTLFELANLWREMRCSDDARSATRFLSHCLTQQVLIIDELAGKAKITDSTRELLYELLEAVHSQKSNTHIWFLGNFYTGSLEDIFPDGGPTRRRLHESFLCYRINEKDELEELKVVQTEC